MAYEPQPWPAAFGRLEKRQGRQGHKVGLRRLDFSRRRSASCSPKGWPMSHCSRGFAQAELGTPPGLMFATEQPTLLTWGLG